MLNKPASCTYQPGEIIFKEGDIGDCSYIIEEGNVEIFIERGGAEETLAVLSENEIFGEMAIIDREPRSAGARALTQCKVGIIEREQISSRIKEADPIVQMLIMVLIKRLRRDISVMNQHRLQIQILQEKGNVQPLYPENSTERNAIDKIRMEVDLRNAIVNDDMELFYQPIIHLPTNEIAGFEALIRWRSKDGNVFRPNSFIAIAEETDLIIPMGQWVIERACQDLSYFSSLPGQDQRRPFFVSINVSGRQLSDPFFFDVLQKHVDGFGLSPHLIKLEMTEQIFVHGDRALAWAKKANELGFSIALDDFGTGYSSLSYLNTFPIDFLKIDRSFIQAMIKDHRSLAIARTIADLGKSLQIPVIAEGIEDEFHLQTTKTLNCEYGQGYYFSKPGDIASVETLILSSTKSTRAA